ncbi:MAG: hypothetical protein PWP31_872 [Clostridia bacterium]|nr:hypothetical protein [Clostridia bacterium]
MTDFALYMHIPFCVRKCNYCGFISYSSRDLEVMNSYCEALKREMELVSKRWWGSVSTIFLGGGTPTVLPTNQLEGLLESIYDFFNIKPLVEISIEANPGTVDLDKYKILLKGRVNRLSLGIQSFDDNLLKTMGRIHCKQDIYESYNLARKAGFDNINLDLIFGLPGQTLTNWQNTLKEAIALQPEHISVYSLQIEEGTYWGNLAANGKLILPGEDLELAMYQEAQSKLSAAGFEHYEISNFAKPGYKCRHNLTYWYNQYYIGIGAAAASFWQDERWRNYTDLKQYNQVLTKGSLPRGEIEILTLKQQMAETMFMGLRLIKGICLENFRQRFNLDVIDVYHEEIDYLLKTGLIEIVNNHLRLTSKGLPLANEVFIHFV